MTVDTIVEDELVVRPFNKDCLLPAPEPKRGQQYYTIDGLPVDRLTYMRAPAAQVFISEHVGTPGRPTEHGKISRDYIILSDDRFTLS